MNRKQTIDFFARSLQAFESSHDAFRVLGTVTTAQQTAAAAAFTAATTAATTTSSSTSKTTATAGDDGIIGAQHALKAKKLIVLDSSFNPPTRAHAQMASSALRDAGNDDDDDNTRLLLLLAVNNADKQAAPAAYPTRLGMMAAFARDLRSTHDVDLGVTTMPFFHDKARSIVESGTYYHHHRHRRHHHPICSANSADGGEERRRLPPEQVFLCGFDTVVRIFDPKYYGASPSAMRAALGPFFSPVSGGDGDGGGSELGARLRVTTRPDDAWGAAEEQRAYLQRLEEEEGGGLAQMGGDAAWVKRIEMVSGLGGAAVSSSRVREVVKRRRCGSDAELGDLVSDGVRAYIEEEGLYRGSLH